MVLVDADRLPYLAALLADQADLCPLHPEPAMKRMQERLEADLIKRLNTTPDKIVYFISTKSFRHELLSTYKGNRRKVWQPEQRDIYVQCFKELVDPWVYNGYEADDMVGIVAKAVPNCIIVSNDKDLDQFPGDHYDPTKHRRYSVLPSESRYFKMYQWIAGDTGDGYGGIKGFGPAKTKDFLAGISIDKISDSQAAKHIRNLYKKKNQLHDCETMRRLAWLLTDVLGASPIPPEEHFPVQVHKPKAEKPPVTLFDDMCDDG